MVQLLTKYLCRRLGRELHRTCSTAGRVCTCTTATFVRFSRARTAFSTHPSIFRKGSCARRTRTRCNGFREQLAACDTADRLLPLENKKGRVCDQGSAKSKHTRHKELLLRKNQTRHARSPLLNVICTSTSLSLSLSPCRRQPHPRPPASTRPPSGSLSRSQRPALSRPPSG